MNKEAFVKKAYRLFDEFYKGTLEFRMKCAENEEFYRANHWSGIGKRESDEPQPVTPVIFSTLEGMLGDIMDNYPEPILLAQEEGDEELAAELDDIIKYILKRRKYRTVYRNKTRSALKKGVSVQEVFWDNSMYGGLGDANIREWDIMNFLWDLKYEDVQEGRAVFKFGFYEKEWFRARYPRQIENFCHDGYTRQGYLGEKNDSDDIMLMEYWYRKYDAKSDTHSVHMAKIAGNTLLEKSEEALPEGMYAHGRYPFIVEPLYPLAGQPVGLGMIDVFKNLQMYADKLDQIILKNTLMSSKVKLLVNKNAEIDEEVLLDWSSEVVRGGRIDESSVRWFQPAPLSGYVLTHFNSKLSAIKEESGQNIFSRGEGGKGITAASAILALQEAGNKRSRMLNDQLFDGFEEMVRMVISVVCENYTEERRFRIRGEGGARTAVFGKKNMDIDAYEDFDVSVNVQQATPYKTLYQNELALQLLGTGIIEGEDAIRMMTFEGKERILGSVMQRQKTEEEAKMGLVTEE